MGEVMCVKFFDIDSYDLIHQEYSGFIPRVGEQVVFCRGVENQFRVVEIIWVYTNTDIDNETTDEFNSGQRRTAFIYLRNDLTSISNSL